MLPLSHLSLSCSLHHTPSPSHAASLPPVSLMLPPSHSLSLSCCLSPTCLSHAPSIILPLPFVLPLSTTCLSHALSITLPLPLRLPLSPPPNPMLPLSLRHPFPLSCSLPLLPPSHAASLSNPLFLSHLPISVTYDRSVSYKLSWVQSSCQTNNYNPSLFPLQVQMEGTHLDKSTAGAAS